MIAKEYIPYIYRIKTKSEKQLKIILSYLEKETTKIQTKRTKKEKNNGKRK
ncbi:hypothetical protein KHD22_001403 [Campylobacter coli]|nr:hypothetical protein [Campylobacter coli]